MKRRWFGPLLGFLLLVPAVAGNPAPKLTDPVVATKLAITVQQLHSLRAKYEVSNETLLEMPPFQLRIMLWEVDHPGIDKHAEEQKFRALRMMDEHGRVPPAGLLRAMEHRRHAEIEVDRIPGAQDPSPVSPEFGTPGPLTAGIQTNSWTWLGPGNIGGRVRAILIHPTLTNILWTGGVDGGVWKSTNSGAGWFPLNDFMGNLAVACLAMDPANPDIIYAGTGEPTHNIDAIRGAGIFKSMDAGNTWTLITPVGNSLFQYIARLAIDPANGSNILAATRSGIMRSVDAGSTWTRPTSTETLQVLFHPFDSTQCLAAGYNGRASYSLNGGLTWTAAGGLPAPTGLGGRVELAYAPSNPSVVFASVDNNNGEIYVSLDGGRSFTRRNTGNSYLGAQGWYDNTIWVDPTSTNVLVVGGIDLWRSTDGGATLIRISQWQSAPTLSAHADHHAIVSHPLFNGTTIRTVYFGNDGGVYRAANVYTVSATSGWECLNHNLGITQFYGGAGNTNTGVIVGGTQDNGTVRYTPGAGPQNWSTMYGGDGGFCAADPSNANYFYGEYVFLQLHRSSNGGSSSSSIYSGISDAGSGSTANFIAPFILDPNNPNTLLAGGASLWRSTNARASTPSWSAIKSSTGSLISAIAAAPGNSDVIWVGHNNGDVYYTTNGTAASPTWYQRDLGTPNLPNRYCERIAISPTNSSRVYVTFGGFNSGNVWRTTDSGLTWSVISGNLPAAPVNSIVISPNDPNILYVGTEVGVYGTSNDGVTWSTGNDGPANVSIDELFWLGNKLIAVTHGRGMYSITPASGAASLTPAGSFISGGNGNGWVDPNECTLVNLVLQNAGGETATNVSVLVSTATPGVTIVQDQSAYPNLPAGSFATNSTPFQISTDPSFACGTPIGLTLAVTFNGTTNVLGFSLSSGGPDYAIVQTMGAAIVPGAADTGNHGDDAVTTIPLPFAVSFYGQAFTNAALSSNGNLQFLSSDDQFNNTCPPYSGFNYAIMPLWDDLRTDSTGTGIFISTNGAAPNRIFNIEWRATYFSGGNNVNFEIRLYEDQNRFDIIYGELNGDGSTATVALQKDTGGAVQSFECNTGGLSAGLQLTFQPNCTDGGGPCSSALLAEFTAGPTNGPLPLTVQFTNASVGATAFAWDFGDGHVSSDTAPAHVYAAAGAFTVTLSAMSATTTNTLTRANYIVVTNVPPAITASPASQTLAAGSDAAFSGSATGSPPPTYQWWFAGAPLPGATDSTFTRTNARCADAGDYEFVASNPAGSVTSSVAGLTVVAPPFISQEPASQTVVAGQPAGFMVQATNACGGGFSYQWQLDGTNLPGATASSFGLASAQPSEAGPYIVVVTTLAGSVTSSVAVLTVLVPPLITSSPASVTIAEGTEAIFLVSATGSPPPTYQWWFAGAPIAGATDTAFTRTNALCADAGPYEVVLTNTAGAVTSSVAVLTVIAPPGIAAEPTNQTVIQGSEAIFTVTATNACGGSLSYQWQLDGTNVAGATDPGFVVTNSQLTDAGNYFVIITNLAGSVTSTVAVLTVLVPPSILTPPASQVAVQGADATFSVSAGGSPTLAYQWRFGGEPLSGATESAFTRNNVQCVEAGAYDVVVANAAGSVTSSLVTLTVVAPPEILEQPTNLTVVQGQQASFTVSATNSCGDGLIYQWQREGTNLDGAVESTLVLAHAQFADAGRYAVVITNLAGSSTSAVATLTVITPAQLVAIPLSLDFGTVLTGSIVHASLVVSNAGGARLTGTAVISGGPFAFTVSDGQLDLPAFTSTNLDISFAAIIAGAYSNVVTFATDGGNSTNSLLGRAVDTFAPLLLSPGEANGTFTFSFESISGVTYIVQHTDALDGTAWSVQESVLGDGTLKTITNAVSSIQRFYRLHVLP
jgi:PKD repeat protein